MYKTEVIHRRVPGRNPGAVEHATLEWVDWFNNRRLLKPIGNIPPAEFEAAYYCQQDVSHGGLAQAKQSPEFPVQFTFVKGLAEAAIRYMTLMQGGG